MGKYYTIEPGKYYRYHCCCGFKTDSWLGIQSHIRVHKKIEVSKQKGQQELKLECEQCKNP